MHVREYVERSRQAETAFKRLTDADFSRKSPSGAERLISRLRSNLLAGDPTIFLAMWGGSKAADNRAQSPFNADRFDRETMDFLAQMKAELNKLIDAQFNVVFFDLHHRVVNGVPSEHSAKYQSSLRPLADERGLEFTQLSSLLLVEPAIENCTDDSSRLTASVVLADPIAMGKAKKAAAKHSSFVADGSILDYEAGGIYIESEIFFLRHVDSLYNGRAVFLSVSDPGLQGPIAQAAGVPLIHAYPTADKRNDCPWYRFEIRDEGAMDAAQ